MHTAAVRAFIVFVALTLVSGCTGRYFHDAGTPPVLTPRYSLADLPQKEYWTGVVFNGAKVGYTRTRVTQSTQANRFDIDSEAVIHFRFLGYDKRIQMHSRDTVDANAQLLAFDYEYLLDESVQRITGEVRGGRLLFQLRSAPDRPIEKQAVALDGPLYPAGALDLLPVLQGLRVGKEFHWSIFNGETQGIAEAEQRIEAFERSELFEDTAFRVRTDMLGMSTTTWIDVRGRPVFELGLNGVMISALEDETIAKSYLANAALSKDDVLVNWSLIKAPLPLADPRRAEFLRFEVLERPAARAPLSDERQRCQAESGRVVCEIDATRTVAPGTDLLPAALQASSTVQSSDPMIRALARKITARSGTTPEKIDAVLSWIEQNIRKEPVDSFSALDVLDTRRGECQGHAYLYAALMRALGVPTRVVNGLVYSTDYGGFLYHTWAESFVDGRWRAVDPTFAQPRADATHIALVRGENLLDLIPIVDWVGNTRIRILEAH